MKTFTSLFVKTLGLLLSVVTLAVAQSPTPLAANGRLKIVGTQLTNESGKGIQLRGMSTHGLQWFDQCYNLSSTQALANSWGADVLRAAMYVDEGGYLNNQSGLRAKINQIVDWTGQAGMYCIIDWHVLNPGNPNERLSYAIDFFRTMAQTHAGKKNVIYEICNEPNGVSWAQIKSYAEQVIPVIRQYDPEAIILVGTPNWDQNPEDAAANPLTGANGYNVMYTFHFYAASHFFQDRIKSVSGSIPLFCSEWGTCTYSGNGNLDFNNGQNWLDMMAGSNPGGQKISWCNWTFSDAGESSAGLNSGACNAQQWNNTSPSGTWVKDHILNPADNFGPATPSISITSPANNTTVNVGSNLTISASVYNATASAVEFYNGTTLLGSDPTAPYTWTVSGIPQGTYSFTAKALVSSGNLTSSTVQVTAAPVPNQPPTVSLTSPANNAAYTTPATIPIAANAADSDGSITKVEFYNGGTKLGEDTSAPYEFSWSGMATGTYTVTAKATDNQGASTTSGAVTVTVFNQGESDPTADIVGPNCVYANAVQVFSVNASKTANATNYAWWCTGSTKTLTPTQPGQVSIDFGPSFTGGQVCVGINYSVSPWYTQYCKNVTVCPGTPTTPTNQAPSVSLTSPSNNATFTAPATVNLMASASDSDGSVTKVEFYNGSTKLGESTSSPYTFSWANVSAGSYALTAKATDNAGATTTSGTVNIQVNNPAPVNQAPTVALTSPVTNATFTAPATINLTASASDADGSVTKVEFYNGSTLLGQSTTLPYTFSWANVAAGSYALTAKATDNSGATTTSATISIQVKTPTPVNQAPTVALTSPVNNATFTAPATVNLTASASDADGSVTKVEFYNGSTKLGESTSSPYTFSWANVAVGTYALTAKATDNSGATTTSATINIQVKTPTPANQPPTVSLTAPTNNATFTAPATVNLTASASDADGSVTKVEFYNGSTLLGQATASPYTFTWTNVAAGTYTLTAKATDNSGATTTSGAITIQINSGSTSTADILGPDCVVKNAVQVYELNASKMTGATSYSWWCEGSTQSITPTQPGKASINFGPWFTGGKVCVGVNYSGAPYYAQYCKNVALCAGARLGADDVADNLVYPNPTHDRFTFVADRDIRAMRVADQTGREQLQLGAAKAGQTITFGEQLPAGIYLLHIQYEAQSQRAVKLLKVGN